MILFNATYIPQLIVEIVVAIIFFGFWLSIFTIWMKKRNKIALALMRFMFIYWIAVVVTVVSQLNLRVLEGTLYPLEYIIYTQSLYASFTFLANWFFYEFYIEIYLRGKEKGQYIPYLIFTIIGIILSFPIMDNGTYRLIVNGILLIHSMTVYIPAMLKSRKIYKQLRQENSKVEEYTPFFFLFWMSLLLIFMWIINVANMAYDLKTSTIYGPFWLVNWILILIVAIFGYIGYTNPPWFRKNLMKNQ